MTEEGKEVSVPITSHMASLAPPEGRASGPLLTEIIAALPDVPNRNEIIKQLVDAERERQQFRQDWQLAYQFAMSGLFQDLKGTNERQAIAAAITKVQLGRKWGLAPADAMRYVYFTNGKPNVENEIVASKMRDAGYDWDAEFEEQIDEHKGKPYKRCIGCTLYLKVWSEKDKAYVPVMDRKGQQVSCSFTEADADQAMIWEGGKQIPLSSKWNFKSWPRDMYFWRTISRIRKFHAPHVLRGAVAQAEVWDVPLEQELSAEPPAAGSAPPEPPEPPPAKRSLKKLLQEQGNLIEPKEQQPTTNQE